MSISLLPRPIHPSVRYYSREWFDCSDVGIVTTTYAPHYWGILAEYYAEPECEMHEWKNSYPVREVINRTLIKLDHEGIAPHPSYGWLARKVDPQCGLIVQAFRHRTQARRWLQGKG